MWMDVMTPKQMQDLALSRGMWACPQCEYGWQQYLIGSDMHVCGVCGYKGGPVTPKTEPLTEGLNHP